jgi:hypothetical protein
MGGEVVEAIRRVGMLGAEHLLVDRQGALKQASREGMGSTALKIAPSAIEEGSSLRICINSFHLADCENMRREQRTTGPCVSDCHSRLADKPPQARRRAHAAHSDAVLRVVARSQPRGPADAGGQS